MAYSLATSYVGEALLSGFDWFHGADPNHGFIAYQSRENAQSMGLYSIDENTGVVRLGVDSSNFYTLDQGRPSIRLESKQSFNKGLFIADFPHMPPSKCGLWPAFWAYGSDWPNNGEIDIIEGVNLNTKNIMSGHTRSGCSTGLSSLTRSASRFTGQQRNAECSAKGANAGCGYDPPAADESSYGDAFNGAGGGVYAMAWDDESIKLWHFARGRIPADVEERMPNPEGWGLPQAVFGGEECDTGSFWRNMNLVLNINFCGDYGGSVWGSSECSHLAPTCEEFVAQNPAFFKDAYWDVRYIDVYERGQSQSATTAPPHPPQPPLGMAVSGRSSKVPTATTTSPWTATESTTSSTASHSTTSESTMSSTALTIVETRMMTVVPQAHTLHGTASLGTTDAATAVNATSPATTTMAPSTATSTSTRRPLDGMRKQPPCSRVPRTFSYAGCLKYKRPLRTFAPIRESPDMTPSKCAAVCASNSMRHAGAFGTLCLCANDLEEDSGTAIPEDRCDQACPGDEQERCGGDLGADSDSIALSVYSAEDDHHGQGASTSGTAPRITVPPEGRCTGATTLTMTRTVVRLGFNTTTATGVPSLSTGMRLHTSGQTVTRAASAPTHPSSSAVSTSLVRVGSQSSQAPSATVPEAPSETASSSSRHSSGVASAASGGSVEMRLLGVALAICTLWMAW